MITGYFNHTMYVAQSRWDRQRFLRAWWRIYGSDRRWAPPYYPALAALLRSDRHPHLQRLQPQFLHLEALPTRRRGRAESGMVAGVIFEEPVAATVLLVDHRSGTRTAYLGEMRIANDGESMERFLGLVTEQLWHTGVRRMVGPVGLSPVLRSGVLMNHFDLTPPMHTAYNPPYVPEVFNANMKVLDAQRLFMLDVPADPPVPVGPARISRTGIRQEGGRLLSLLMDCGDWPDIFPAPDPAELRYVLAWLASQAPLQVLLARERGRVVGIAVLQNDLARRLQRARGGRNLLWRWWFQWRRRFPTRQGRIILGGVLPDARGRGIGSQLMAAVLVASRQAGWQKLAIGPVVEDSNGAAILERWGAEPMHRYCIYANEL